MKKLLRFKNGFLYILLPALFLMALNDALAKYVSAVPLFEKLFVRGCFSLVPIFFLKWRTKEPFAPGSTGWLMIRVISAFGSALCSYYAVSNMDLASFSMLKYLSPMVTFLGGVLVFHEKFTRNSVYALLISFGGTLLVFVPAMTLSTNILPYIAALGASLFCGFIGIAERGMGETAKKPSNPTTVSICCTVFLLVASLPFLPGNFLPLSSTEVAILAVQAFLMAIGQVMLTFVYQHEDVTRLGVYDYTAPLWSVLIGVVLFSEMPRPLTIAGSILIIGSGIPNLYSAT